MSVYIECREEVQMVFLLKYESHKSVMCVDLIEMGQRD